MSDELRVLVVDDHPVYRDGLRQLLTDAGLTVVGEAGDGAEAVAYASRHPVDVVLMDLHMPRLDGVGAIRALREVAPDVRVIVLSTYVSEADVVPAIEAGAAGYLLKDASRTELVDGVRAAARGEHVLAPQAAGTLFEQVRNPPAEPLLKPREVELLRLVAAGATNREAAAGLFVSEATVKAYLQHIYDRLGARDRASAVAEGYRRGLLT